MKVHALHMLLHSQTLPNALATSQTPTVIIANGTIVGKASNGVDTFESIPFAQPPVGNLRFRPPLPLNQSFGTFYAIHTAQKCPQVLTTTIPGFSTQSSSQQIINEIRASPKSGNKKFVINSLVVQPVGSEDCLTLNVQRSTGTTSFSNLPVLVWIHGGGFELGGTSSFDSSPILKKAASMNEQFIFVSMNYRLGAFGFLSSKEVQKEGSTNIGLRDQRFALEWIQENIKAFGGDPSRVTIWGESAGSWSVFDQTIIKNGDITSQTGRPLFRAAIMNSGTILPTRPVDNSKPQYVFDNFASAAGCGKAINKMSCLRAANYSTLFNAQDSAAKGTNLPFAYLPRPDPTSDFYPLSGDAAITQGHFARVPILTGDQEDEGTYFVQGGPDATTAQIEHVFTTLAPMAKTFLSKFVPIYPDDPSAGSPFNTGSANEVYPGYKRLAAVFGDVLFTLARRFYLDAVCGKVACWNYINTYDAGLATFGTSHTTDILLLYQNLSLSNTAADDTRTRYISFVNHLNPDYIGLKNKSKFFVGWPKWTPGQRLTLSFNKANQTVVTDSFRESAYQALKNGGFAQLHF